MTRADQLAEFVARASYDVLSGRAREELKIRLIDSLGCAIGALEGEPVRVIRDQIHEFNGSGLCTCIGCGRTAPDRALGGEKFWENIQDAIAKWTAKFVFVLTHASNKKTGTLDELNCALGVEKKLGTDGFIVTLKLDDLPYEDVYINIQGRNHIDFRNSWAAGLAQLLKR